MKLFKTFFLVSLLSVFMLSLSACSGVFSEPPTPTVTLTATETPTDLPTSTATPTASLTPTITPTPTVTPTPTPDTGTDISKAKVLTHGMVDNWNYFIELELPSEPKGEFHAVVDDNKVYTCNVSAKHSNRLICIGQMAAFNDHVKFNLYVKGYEAPLYTTEIFIASEF